MNCGGRLTREAWAKQGCAVPVALDLALHAEVCSDCATFIGNVKRARQVAVGAETHRLSPARVADIQVLLRAEARRPRVHGFVARGNQRRWQWLAVVAIGLLAGTAGVAAVQVGVLIGSKLAPAEAFPSPPAQSSTRAPSAVQHAKNEVVTLSSDTTAEPRLGARAAPMAPSGTSRVRLADASAAPDDSAFADAFRLLGSGKPAQAATAFDGLLKRSGLDPSRRADVLYWASQAHARANNQSLAEVRARAYFENFPNSLHHGDAALMLGDFARNRGANAQAKSYYARALGAARPATRERARVALSLI